MQIEYAPGGAASGLCAGLATAAYENEGLSLQPCSTPGTTVFIIDTADSPHTAPTYFPMYTAAAEPQFTITASVTLSFAMDQQAA